jgi:hypothetical protein
MLPIGGERRLRFVAVFWAAYTASHRLACTWLRGVPNPNHNGEPRINPRGACSPPTSGIMILPASFGQRARTVPISKDMEAHLLILVQLRNNAADCIRLAEAARTSEHKSLFIEMAERWLTLAERAEKTRGR